MEKISKSRPHSSSSKDSRESTNNNIHHRYTHFVRQGTRLRNVENSPLLIHKRNVQMHESRPFTGNIGNMSKPASPIIRHTSIISSNNTISQRTRPHSSRLYQTTIACAMKAKWISPSNCHAVKRVNIYQPPKVKFELDLRPTRQESITGSPDLKNELTFVKYTEQEKEEDDDEIMLQRHRSLRSVVSKTTVASSNSELSLIELMHPVSSSVLKKGSTCIWNTFKRRVVRSFSNRKNHPWYRTNNVTKPSTKTTLSEASRGSTRSVKTVNLQEFKAFFKPNIGVYPPSEETSAKRERRRAQYTHLLGKYPMQKEDNKVSTALQMELNQITNQLQYVSDLDKIEAPSLALYTGKEMGDAEYYS